MIRTLLAVVVALASVNAAEAARHHRKAPAGPKAAASSGLLPGQIYPNRPAWAPPGTCFSDEGYGRFLECGMGGKGG